MTERFLPGVPGAEIEAIFNAAPGNEIKSGKFDSPESSAALAANVFGYFLNRAGELPALPGCPDVRWPAEAVTLETEVRFPWGRGKTWLRGGRHPVLDAVVTTPTTLIGVESKRFEPFRQNRVKKLSESYWRKVWGNRMKGYERVRDELQESKGNPYLLDMAQLFKHAFALRTAVQNDGAYPGLTPILFYLYAEPARWPEGGRPINPDNHTRHKEEIAAFAKQVASDEVKFVSCSYRQLLEEWVGQGTAAISRHAAQALVRFAP